MSDILINSVLTDALITLAQAFKEAGVNPPKKIEVDSPTFNKLLSEAMMLYNIDSKKAVSEREFRLSDIFLITEQSSIPLDKHFWNPFYQHIFFDVKIYFMSPFVKQIPFQVGE